MICASSSNSNMNILASYKWIKEFTPTDRSPKGFAREMSLKSMSIEKIEDLASKYENVVIGIVREVRAHPGADKLKLCVVDIGGREVMIVCGGVNVAQGMRVVVALPGAKVRWHGEGELVELAVTKIRGEESFGMICAPNELGFEKAPCVDHGIWDVTELLSAPAGTPFAEAFDLHDTLFEIEVTTNRPDAMNIVGLAREAGAVLGESFNAPMIPEIPSPSASLPLSVSVQDSVTCPRYMAVVIDGVKVGPSPAWLQQRILLSGHRPINNIVDITNYVLHELGQPLHAFDYDLLEGNEIIVRRAKDGEKMTALDGKEYTLTGETLVIADKTKPSAIAGVMGGANSGVSEKTTRIVFEAANFLPVPVRKTSRALNLFSDSQSMYEKGLSTEALPLALARAVELTLEIAGGAVASPVIDERAGAYKPLVFPFSPDRARAMLGIPLETQEMLRALTALGFDPRGSGDSYLVTVPYFRDHDIEHSVDFTEEIARMYGYGNLPSVLPNSAPPSKGHDRTLLLEDDVKSLLQMAGYTEVFSYSFTSEAVMAKYDLPVESAVAIYNPLLVELSHMRTSLIPSVLTAVVENQAREKAGMIFELSRVYEKRAGDLPNEKTHLCVARFNEAGNDDGFFALKGLVEELAQRFGLTFTFVRETNEKWHRTRSASILIDGAQVGTLGEVAGVYQARFGIDAPVLLLSLDLEALFPKMKLTRRYVPEPLFQDARRDLSLLVLRETAFVDLSTTIKSASQLVESVGFVEEYKGDGVPEGKKSVTLSLTLRAADRTLTSEEVEGEMTKITGAVTTAFNATIR